MILVNLMGDEVVCSLLEADGGMKDGDVPRDEDSIRKEAKRSSEWVVDSSEFDVPNKKQEKEVSNDESKSEVLNPLKENGSSCQIVSSKPVDLIVRLDRGDVLTTSIGDSGEDVADNGENCVNDVQSSRGANELVLEGPKSSVTGKVRRIIFKFSKSKDCHDGVSSSANHCMEVDKGTSNGRFRVKHEMDPCELSYSGTDMLEGTSREAFHRNVPRGVKRNSKKDLSDMYPNTVKKLLCTGILEGADVKYMLGNVMLCGIVSDYGYLCGCGLCNYTKVLNAHEFEQHAGCKTRHPNSHIYLDNGKTIYSIVEQLRSTPLNSLDEAIKSMAGSSVNEQTYLIWKGSLEQANLQQCEGEGHEDDKVQLDLSGSVSAYSSEATEESLLPSSSSFVQKHCMKQKRYSVRDTSKKNHVQKRSTKRSQMARMDSGASRSVVYSGGRGKKRDNDLHRVLFMPNGLPDGAQLAYYSKGERVLEGYKQGDGIVCSCCNTEISPSSFEAHAGWSTRRQPYRHIYTSKGVTLHDLSISLANGQSLAASDGDVMCTVCGDGGDLIHCNGCPRTFHSVCLEPQCVPESNWYCPYCKDRSGIGGNASSSRVRTATSTRLVDAPGRPGGGCAVCRGHDFSVGKFDERTVMLCDQCEKEYHVGCLRDRRLCDLKELPKEKWFCCEDCNRIHSALRNLILTGAGVIPPSLSNLIDRKLVEKGLADEVGDDVRWQVINGQTGSPEDWSWLSRATAIFRGSFDPIVERFSGRDLIPAMVYGKNVAGLEFGGMYCAVLTVRSVVVSAGVFRIFGKEAAEIPLVATTKGRQGKGYFQALFSCIERFLSRLNVENIVLPAAEEAISIWTNKFGFREMSADRFQEYTKDLHLMTFKGTLMLEKAVPRIKEQLALVT